MPLVAAILLAGTLGNELWSWEQSGSQTATQYRAAEARARALGRPLRIVHAHQEAAWRTAPSDSAVLLVPGALEEAVDAPRLWQEILRVAGGRENVYLVTQDPWSFRSALDPSVRWTVHQQPGNDAIVLLPASLARRALVLGGLAALVAGWATTRSPPK